MAFEQLRSVIADGIEQNLHTCVQICISINGDIRLNTGFGSATPQFSASADTIMLWRSAGKPLTAVGILKLAEHGELSIDDPLIRHLPAVQGTPFEQLTLNQLMTHDTGLPALETHWPHSDWDEILAGILSTPISVEMDRTAYQPQATWFLLGEILRRKANTATFVEALSMLVLSPLNMNRCDCGLSDHQIEARHDSLPDLYMRKGRHLQRSSLSDGQALRTASPGGNMRGPVSDLVLLYEMLLRQGTLPDGRSYLKESSVAAMTQRQRIDRFDQTLQHRIDMGLGCILNSEHHGPLVPYGYGQFSSADTFGHGGAQCSMGFCDPVRGLVVAWAANGICSEPLHQRRNRTINEAIYRDLEFAMT